MPIGFRAFLDFERPSHELVESFRGIPSSNIGDCVRKMYCMFDGIHPFNENGLLGTAFTVKVPSGEIWPHKPLWIMPNPVTSL